MTRVKSHFKFTAMLIASLCVGCGVHDIETSNAPSENSFNKLENSFKPSAQRLTFALEQKSPVASFPKASYQIIVGEKFVVAMDVVDENKDKLSFKSETLPEGAVLDEAAGTFVWTPSTIGSQEVIIHVSDGFSSVDATLNLIVKKAPRAASNKEADDKKPVTPPKPSGCETQDASLSLSILLTGLGLLSFKKRKGALS